MGSKAFSQAAIQTAAFFMKIEAHQPQ